jgi:NADH-quinone oxidoreductase subunit I
MITFLRQYFLDIYHAVRSLLKGMKLTGYYFTHPKEIITEQYPDNRATLNLPERFRGEVVMHTLVLVVLPANWLVQMAPLKF